MLETVAEEAFTLLQKATDFSILEAYNDPKFLAETDENVVAIVTRGKGQVDKNLLSKYPKLQVVARCGVGLDNVDVAEATRLGVKVVNAPGSNAETIAEHAITLMLLLQRNLIHSVLEVKKGNWASRTSYEGDEVNEKTLGILGLGNIGKKVASIAKALGMKVQYWDMSQQDVPYRFRTFEEILRSSDIISLHIPLFESTKNLIDARSLSLMKANCILINTARGGIIDQQALTKALKNGQIAGFAADVLVNEPPATTEEILAMPNTLITPHVGSLTTRTYNYMCSSTVKNVLALLRSEAIDERNIFNLKSLST